jgi:ferrous iron transport protein B
MLGVFLVNILYSLKIFEIAGNLLSPIMTKVFGLPSEAVGSLLIGFLRKDVAVGMLIPLNLSFKQMVISSVVLSISFPCIAVFAVLLKELGIKDMIKASLIMIGTAFLVGGFLNLVLAV